MIFTIPDIVKHVGTSQRSINILVEELKIYLVAQQYYILEVSDESSRMISLSEGCNIYEIYTAPIRTTDFIEKV